MPASDPVEWLRSIFVIQYESQSGSIPPVRSPGNAVAVGRAVGIAAPTQILAVAANTVAVTAPVAAGQQVSVGSPPPPPMPFEWLKSWILQQPAPSLFPGSSGAASGSQAGSGIATAAQIYTATAGTAGRAVGTASGQVPTHQPTPPQHPAEWMLSLFLQLPHPASFPTTVGGAHAGQAGAGVATGHVVGQGKASDSQMGVAAATPMGVNLGSAVAVGRGTAISAGANVLTGFAAGTVQHAAAVAAPVQQAPTTPPLVLPPVIILGQFGLDAVLYRPAPSLPTVAVGAGTAVGVQVSTGTVAAVTTNPGHAVTAQRGVARAAHIVGPSASTVGRAVAKASPTGIAVASATGSSHGATMAAPLTVSACTATGRQLSVVFANGSAILPVVTTTSQRSLSIAGAVLVQPNQPHLPGLVSPASRAGAVNPKELAGVA